MVQKVYYKTALKRFRDHYKKSFTKVRTKKERLGRSGTEITLLSSELKKGNGPRMYLQKKQTPQTIVLCHGLSDSPHYVSAIAKCFFDIGLNVVLPLLPAHGLKEPDAKMEDTSLDSKWKIEIDEMTEIAELLGAVVSLGGFSAGGALCYNKVLRDGYKIKGGLFLFAAAIDIKLAEDLARLKFVSKIAEITDGTIVGHGRNPYKYPKFPYFGALELGEIIGENNVLTKGRRISQPVFAVHSLHDTTVKLSGVLKLLKSNAEVGSLYTISHKVLHSDLPLNKDIPENKKYTIGTLSQANPEFDLMMEACISFWTKWVGKKSK